MPTYTISHVAENTREWTNQAGGRMVDYKLTVKDPSGAEVSQVELTQKPETAVPQVGQTIDGDIQTRTIDTARGPMQVKKLKRAQQAGGGFGGSRQRDPKETAAIQRQHSQSAAVAFLAAKVAAGALEGPFPSMDQFRLLIDWFQRDIEDGVRLSQQPGYGQPRRVKEPVKTGGSDVPEPAAAEFEHPKTDLDKTPWAV